MFEGNSSTFFHGTVKRKVKSNDIYSNINTAVALGKFNVPLKHKQLASNYVLIKKIFGHRGASIPITNADRAILSRHGFLPLEHSSVAQINHQIEQIKDWANSGDIILDAYANELFEIRIKELKYMRLTINPSRDIEFNQGYKALEKYIDYIAR